MNLVPALLSAVVDAHGDAVVIHSGDIPYVDIHGESVPILGQPLTPERVHALLQQLLPAGPRQTFERDGLVHYDCPYAEYPHEHFVIVACREAGDVWVEIRRHRSAATKAAADDPGLMLPDFDELWPVTPAAPPQATADAEPSLSAVVERAEPEREPSPAVVLPMARSPFQHEPPPAPPGSTARTNLVHLLQIVAARRGSILYVSSGERPSMRVDGEIRLIADEPVLTPDDVQRMLLAAMPERSREELRTTNRTEWRDALEGVGPVRCVMFDDQRGGGGVFRLMPSRTVTAEQLGLTKEMRGLALEPDGLVLVTGPRSSGKSTLISAYVDLINRTRRDHVITIENEVRIVHERHGSLISQREVLGSAADQLAAAEHAVREDPDVLVIEDLRSDAIVRLAVDAAASGRLVIGGLPGRTAAGALDRILDQYQPADRVRAQLALAANLRGLIIQHLLRKPGGGRVSARGLLLNTAAVAELIAAGRTSQLTLAMEAGETAGMTSVNAALAGLVKSGTVDIGEAYRQAGDRTGFLAVLRRYGVETSSLVRLA